MGKTPSKLILAGCLALTACFAGKAFAADKKWGQYQVEDRRSGYTFAAPETRAVGPIVPARIVVSKGTPGSAALRA